MLKRLMMMYQSTYGWVTRDKIEAIKIAINLSPFVRKGQEQSMADYMALELLEEGRL